LISEPHKKSRPRKTRSDERFAQKHLVFFVSGMGPRNAKGKAEEVLAATTEPYVSGKPSAVLVIGPCGGLNKSPYAGLSAL